MNELSYYQFRGDRLNQVIAGDALILPDYRFEGGDVISEKSSKFVKTAIELAPNGTKYFDCGSNTWVGKVEVGRTFRFKCYGEDEYYIDTIEVKVDEAMVKEFRKYAEGVLNAFRDYVISTGNYS